MADGLSFFTEQGQIHWIAQVFVAVLATLLINFVKAFFIRRLATKAEKSRNVWDDALVAAVDQPLTLAIWIVGLALAADIILVETETAIFEAVDPIRDVGVIGALAWALIRLIGHAEANFKRRHRELEEGADETTIEALGKLLRLTVVITAGLVVLQTLGFSVSGVLAFGGIGGIAVGFAARDLLANFFGGLMVYLDKPFNKGDWVRSPDRNIEGVVEQIGWRLTMIRTFDKRPLYVPNSVFNQVSLENPSRMSHRRIFETVGIRYEDIDKMDGITRDVKAMLEKHDEIDDTQTMIVNFNTFSDSSIDFFVYTFTHTTNWVHYHEVKHDVLLRIAGIIAEHGAEIAFPTSTIHLAEDAKTAMAPQSPVEATSAGGEGR